MKNFLGFKIKELREKKGWTQADLAERVATTFQLISKYERGEVKPSHQTLIKICEVLEVSANVLIGTDNETEKERLKIETPTRFSRILPLKSWIEVQHRIEPKHLSMMIMEGDSMSPFINSGDLLILDDNVEEQVHLEEGFFVVRLNDGGALVKRLQPLPGGIIKVSSARPQEYETFTVSKSERADFRIEARVIWICKRA